VVSLGNTFTRVNGYGTTHMPRTESILTNSMNMKRNDVFRKNRRDDSFAVVIEQKGAQVRWANHPVRTGESAGGSSSVESFLEGHTRVDQDTDLAKSVAEGASELVAKLPRPLYWDA
jgi:hypothetical protein